MFYRPGVGMLGDFEKTWNRWEREREDNERCRASPACMFTRETSTGHFQHLYGAYQHYHHNAIIETNMDRLKGEPDLFYGYTVLIRLIFVMPEFRGRGVASDIMYRLTRAAEETGCVLTACCSPVEFNWCGDGIDTIRGSPGEERTPEEQCKYVARMFTEFGSSMEYLDLSKKENKDKQRRQRQRFLDNGFRRVLIPDNLSKKNRRKLSHWTVAYVPQNCPQEMRDFIEPKLR